MGPEFWVGLAAVFVSGGAVGAAGTLLAQWIVRKMHTPGIPRPSPDERELELLRADVADMARQIQNLDARLDFQEQLLGGASPTSGPPPRLADRGEKAEPDA
ncbi:MAG: hypothetical protein PVJ02_03690 [Gemmatimonadota bacterium]|jgi:hypothetical protein